MNDVTSYGRGQYSGNRHHHRNCVGHGWAVVFHQPGEACSDIIVGRVHTRRSDVRVLCGFDVVVLYPVIITGY